MHLKRPNELTLARLCVRVCAVPSPLQRCRARSNLAWSRSGRALGHRSAPLLFSLFLPFSPLFINFWRPQHPSPPPSIYRRICQPDSSPLVCCSFFLSVFCRVCNLFVTSPSFPHRCRWTSSTNPPLSVASSRAALLRRPVALFFFCFLFFFFFFFVPLLICMFLGLVHVPLQAHTTTISPVAFQFKPALP